MTIGIINAMHKQHEQIASLVTDGREVRAAHLCFLTGKLGGNTLVLGESGIGKVNAALCAATLISEFKPDAVINTGVAGGLEAKVGVMHVVVGQRVAYHDVDCGPESEKGQVQGLPRYFEADSRLLRAAESLASPTPLHLGLICSGDRFITSAGELAEIKATYPEALAVDMESGAIAQTCHLLGVPFLSFRIISDTPGAEGHFEQYNDFWGTMAQRSFGVTKLFLENLPHNI